MGLLWHPYVTLDTLWNRVQALCLSGFWHPCTLKHKISIPTITLTLTITVLIEHRITSLRSVTHYLCSLRYVHRRLENNSDTYYINTKFTETWNLNLEFSCKSNAKKLASFAEALPKITNTVCNRANGATRVSNCNKVGSLLCKIKDFATILFATSYLNAIPLQRFSDKAAEPY